jgi:hypothetical protein
MQVFFIASYMRPHSPGYDRIDPLPDEMDKKQPAPMPVSGPVSFRLQIKRIPQNS